MKKRKVLSSIMAAAMVLSLVPATALAAEGTGEDTGTHVLATANLPAVADWAQDRTAPLSWTETGSNGGNGTGYITSTTTSQTSSNSWYDWQGRSAKTQADFTNYWAVETELMVTESMLDTQDEGDGVRASIWVKVDGSNIGADSNLDWSILQFCNDGDKVTWQWWDSQNTGNWLDVKGVEPAAGLHTLKIEFDNGTINQYVDGAKVNSYKLGNPYGYGQISSASSVILESRTFGESYSTTWKIPTVQYVEEYDYNTVFVGGKEKDVNTEYETREGVDGIGEVYETMTEALAVVPENGTIVLGGNMEVSAKMLINEKLTLDGNGYEIKASDTFYINNSDKNGTKHLLGIEGEAAKGTIVKDITLDSNNIAYGVQPYDVKGTIVLNNVTLKNSKGTGMTVNGSSVEADRLTISGSGWGQSIDVSNGAGIEGSPMLTLTNSDLKDPIGIFEDISTNQNPNGAVVKVDHITYSAYKNTTIGKWIYLADMPVKIGENGYWSLAEAVAAAGTEGVGTTITLTNDITLSTPVEINKSGLVIDGDNHTITANGCAGIYIKNDLDSLEVRNLTLKGTMNRATAGETMDGEPFMGIGTYNGNYGVTKLALTNVTVDGFTYGLYFGQNPSGNTNPINSAPVSIVANALTVKNSYVKGVYMEKLSNSSFTGCVFKNNGHDISKVSSGVQTWMCGIDINLKNGTYQNITFDGCAFTGNGANRGTALHIKARGTGTDSASYGTETTLTGVTITGCTFSANNAADAGANNADFGPVVFGEPGKGNTSPTNISIQKDVAFTNNLTGVVKVIFDSDGGSAVPTTIIAANGTITLPSAPSRANYAFQGWSNGETTYGAGAEVTIPADTTFTAQWSVISTGGSSSGGSTTTKPDNTETVTNPDGSTTTTVTKPDGSKTETTKAENGATSVVTTDKDGKVEAEVKLPAAVVSEAAEAGQTVALPMPAVTVTDDSESAATVTVDLPANTTAKVEIPVSGVTAGTVAVLMKADGTEKVIKTTLMTENGVAVTLSDGDTVKIVDNAKTFTDVPATHWGADAVAFATSRELFNGTGATTFDPAGEMTRAMIVTVLARYDGVDTTTGSTWYEAGAAWAVEKGVSDGASLDNDVSREQLVTMLWRYLGSPVVEADLTAYPDSASVSDWAAQAMAWAVDTGIITGTGAGELNPQGTATRVEVATMLARFVEAAN